MTKVFDKDGRHIGNCMDGLTAPKIRRMKKALYRKIVSKNLSFQDIDQMSYHAEEKILCRKLNICDEVRFNDFKKSFPLK